ncbi:alpha/beta fold hydrolase [Ruegeria sp. EL01]|jgi:pimeloyl-ACP methyl ester carboxylesterase|uniref:alpha/beta fold hydrolase n=1 Tax=Ruegeria sp. EL01 TaxID=2107578 RepID=UPI0013C4D5EB|nr:alpha/beta hydrolase [Ruegeria sp. EL01]
MTRLSNSAEAIPDQTKRRGRLKKWTLIAIGSFVALLVLTAFGAFGFQTLRNNRIASEFELPGTMITTAHGDLYVNCQGDRANPAIILENGMGLASENWDWIQSDLAEDFLACAYDRSGIGFSQDHAEAVDAGHSAETLAQLIEQVGITDPVLVVGHSYGALIARVFADRFPDTTAGLVLVDSSHEDMAERFPPEERQGFRDMLDGFSILRTANHFGGARMMGVPEMFAPGLEEGAKTRATYLYESVPHMAGSAAEAEGWTHSAQLAREVAGRGLADLPLVVIMVDGWPETMMPSWSAMQNELASLSSSGSVTVIEGADHFGVLTRPRFAKQVAEAIRLLAQNAF